jgi:hypothetical protein
LAKEQRNPFWVLHEFKPSLRLYIALDQPPKARKNLQGVPYPRHDLFFSDVEGVNIREDKKSNKN